MLDLTALLFKQCLKEEIHHKIGQRQFLSKKEKLESFTFLKRKSSMITYTTSQECIEDETISNSNNNKSNKMY